MLVPSVWKCFLTPSARTRSQRALFRTRTSASEHSLHRPLRIGINTMTLGGQMSKCARFQNPPKFQTGHLPKQTNATSSEYSLNCSALRFARPHLQRDLKSKQHAFSLLSWKHLVPGSKASRLASLLLICASLESDGFH